MIGYARSLDSRPARAAGVGAILRGEWLKYRRTGVLLAPLIAGAGSALLAAFIGLQMAHDKGGVDELGLNSGSGWHAMTFMLAILWGVVWLPFNAAFLGGAAADLEGKTGSWRVLRARATSPTALFASKLAFLAGASLLGAIATFLTALLAGSVLFGTSGAPVGVLATILTVLWALNLPLLPLHLWVGAWRGLGGSMLLAVLGGLMVGQILKERLWQIVPWAWPNLLINWVAGLLRDGTASAAGSISLEQLAAYAALILVAGLAGSLWWFARREER